MTTQPTWSDVPPSEAGWYWLRKLRTGQAVVRYRNDDAYWPVRHLGSDDQVMRDYYQFGPRVLSAEETVNLTAEVERLRAEKRILNERYDLLEQENDSLRRNGVVIYVGSEELQQLRAAAAELAEIKRAWGMA